MRKIYTSVDLGSNSIKIMTAEIYDKKLNVLAVSEVKSRGIKNGLIIDANEILSSLKEAISDIENKLSITIDKVVASVPSYYANFEIVNGEIDISREDERVTGNDVVTVLKSAVIEKVKKDREIVTVIPIYFIVNGKKNIKDPKGLICKKLGVKAMMVTTPSKNVQSIISIFQSIGIDVVDVNLGPIADYNEFSNNNTNEGLTVIVNVGYDITTVSLFNKGIIINSEIIQIGGKNIDNDISYVFKIDKETSSKLKESFAVAHKKFSRVNEIKECITVNKDLISITQYDISQVVMSRLTEILKLAKKQSYLLTNREISYIIITGGSSEIPGMSYLVEDVFGDTAHVGNIDTIGIRNNKYSVVSGLIRCFDSKLNLRDKEFSMVDFDGENISKKINLSDNNSVLSKVFGYFFDN
ncbi:MAG: cell division protein FtsA [Bacilli bacterium]|nr:cell division protein FtsA [Bacilli bacterium]